MVSVSDGAAAEKTQELDDLTSRKPIGNKRGPVDDEIFKLLVYAGQQMHGAQIKIEIIRKALNDFVIQKKEGGGSSRQRH